MRLHDALRDGNDILNGRSELDLGLEPLNWHALKGFTDNIVIGWPIYDDGEVESGMVFERVAEFQREMVLRGFFCEELFL
jgi:hypothetical protein